MRSAGLERAISYRAVVEAVKLNRMQKGRVHIRGVPRSLSNALLLFLKSVGDDLRHRPERDNMAKLIT